MMLITARAVITALQSMCVWCIVLLPPVLCGPPRLRDSLGVPRLRHVLSLPPQPWRRTPDRLVKGMPLATNLTLPPLGLMRERLCSSLRQRLQGSRVQLEEPAHLCLLVRQHTRGRRRRLGSEPGAEQREQDRHTRAECEPQDE